MWRGPNVKERGEMFVCGGIQVEGGCGGRPQRFSAPNSAHQWLLIQKSDRIGRSTGALESIDIGRPKDTGC